MNPINLYLSPYDIPFLEQNAVWVKQKRIEKELVIYYATNPKTKIVYSNTWDRCIFDNKRWIVLKDCFINRHFIKGIFERGIETKYLILYSKTTRHTIKHKYSGDTDKAFTILRDYISDQHRGEVFNSVGPYVRFCFPWANGIVYKRKKNNFESVRYVLGGEISKSKRIYNSPNYFQSQRFKEIFSFKIRYYNYQHKCRFINPELVHFIYFDTGYSQKIPGCSLSLQIADKLICFDICSKLFQKFIEKTEIEFVRQIPKFTSLSGILLTANTQRLMIQLDKIKLIQIRGHILFHTSVSLEKDKPLPHYCFCEQWNEKRMQEIFEKTNWTHSWETVKFLDGSTALVNLKTLVGCNLSVHNSLIIRLRNLVFEIMSNEVEDIAQVYRTIFQTAANFKSCLTKLP